MGTALVVEDHPVVATTLKLILETLGYKQIHVVSNCAEVVSMIREHAPGVVVLDLALDTNSGLDLLLRIRAIGLSCKVVVFTSKDPAHYLARCRRAGAMAYVSKSADLQQLRNAIKAVRAGYTYFPALGDPVANKIAVQSTEQQLIDQLSDRELHILVQLAHGKANKDIAEEMHLSHKTISTYKTRLMTKLSINSQVLLRELAKRNQLI